MKLAEALLIRADLQKKVETLKVRLIRNAKVQEGELPAEAPDMLLEALDHTMEELGTIIRNINHTNANISIDGVGTIADALVKRDMLMLKRSVLLALLNEAAEKQNRYSGTEIKILCTVNVSDIQKQIDHLSAKYREMDTKIQEKNWLAEII